MLTTPVRLEERTEGRPLLGSPDEGVPHVRQVVGDHAQGAQRRELLAEIRVSQLEQLLGVDEAS